MRDRRGANPVEERPFPFVRVDLSAGTNVRAGRENFSTANQLDQDVYELTDDFTWLKGRHTLTVGTHNEFFKFRNLFIRDNFGNYRFANLDLFEQGIAQGYDYSFSVTGDPQQAAKFRVRQFGFYAGDQWRALTNLTLTYGLRVDIPTFPDTPTANPVAVENFGYATNVVPGGTLWAPRVGFNYAIGQNGTEQVRGGVGMFSGRTPYVWLSNQYGNTGNEFQRLQVAFNAANRNVPFNPDPNSQPTSLGNIPANEIDLIDPDYKYPSLIRTNIGYDRDLRFFGLIGTAEFLYSTNLNDIKYQNLNLVPVGTRPDGRVLFARNKVPSLTDVIFLTNTDQGDSWSIVFKVDRPYRNGVFMSGSYLYGEARSILDGQSSQAASNWANVYVPGDINNPPLVRSNFDSGHRITMAGGYDLPVGKGFTAVVSLFYSAQSGRPWSANYNGDANGDVRFTNDLVYFPAREGEVTFTNGTFADFQQFVNSEECLAAYVGEIHVRNVCRAPWINTFDFRLNVGLPFKRLKAEITWDVLNLLNLFDSQKGLVRFANFNDLLLAVPTYPANLPPNYNIAGLFATVDGQRVLQTPQQLMIRDDLRSRWQMQLGARIRF